MNPTKTRLTDLGASWEDSEAAVTLTTSDALALGVKAPAGKPPTIKGKDILPRAHALPDDADAMPDGSEPTPAQQSVGPGPANPAKADESAQKPKK